MAFLRKKPPAIGVKAPYPGFIEPALATSIDKVPKGERCRSETRHDSNSASPSKETAPARGYKLRS